MTKFEIIITESDEGITMEIRDIENRKKVALPVTDDNKVLSVHWMALYILRKSKEIIRLSKSELAERAAKFEK